MIFVEIDGFAQTSQQVFGKNRIQFKNFKWEFLSTQNFDIYFYYGGRESAIYASKYAELDFVKITDLIGFTTYKKIKVLVYNTPKDLLQSNITSDEPSPVAGGVTNFVKSKMEVAFQGNHVLFRADINKEIARYLINELMYGGSIKEIFQNSYLMSLPDWYISGFAQYVGYGWNQEMDNHMRSLSVAGKLKSPNAYTGKEAELLGQSVWNFIVEKYGKSNVSSILQMTQITRNHQDAISSVLGISYKEFITSWEDYYLKINIPIEDVTIIPSKTLKIKKRNKKNRVYEKVIMSNTGEYLVYVQHHKGRYNIKLHNVTKKKRKLITRGGMRVVDQKPDVTLPLISCGADRIGVVDIKRNKLYLTTYDSRGRRDKRVHLPGFEHILDYDFSDDGNAIVFSGQINGQSDLYYYNFKDNTYRQLTSDFNDDLQPRFLKNSLSIVFSSNRAEDTVIFTRVYPEKIKVKNFRDNLDLFIYDNIKGVTRLRRLTNTTFNETQPQYYDSQSLLYLSDQTGINQLYKLDLATKRAHMVSNFMNDIKTYDVFSGTSSISYIMKDRGKEYVYHDPNFLFKNNYDTSTAYTSRKASNIKNLKIVEDAPIVIYSAKDSVKDDEEIDINQVKFQSEEDIDTDNYKFDQDKNQSQNDDMATYYPSSRRTFNNFSREISEDMIKRTGPVKYKNQLSFDRTTNAILYDNLRGFGTLNEAGLVDMMGNHKISAGMFAKFDFRTSSMWAQYEYLKRRVDFRFKVDKTRYFIIQESNTLHKYGSNKFESMIAYPFSNTSRVSFTPTYTNLFFLQMSPSFFANKTDKVIDYLGAKVEYCYDNTSYYGLNMMEGIRFKASYESQKVIGSANYNYSVLDVDGRGYLKLHKELLLAVRGSGGQFLGNAKKSFMIGGMDNWVNGSNDNSGTGNPLNGPDEDYVNGYPDILLNRFVTNMRGFQRASLYGNKYFLFNAELRWPIIRYFYKRRTINSTFLRNLQITGFGDFGSAWSGSSPFQRQNNYSQIPFDRTPFSGLVTTFRSPILTSYGLGIRSYVSQYCIKLDVAWGIRDYKEQKPSAVISIGHDF